MVYKIPSLVEDRISPRAKKLIALLDDFVENECIPAEETFLSQLGQGENRWK
ncbi:7977_t:CDS:2, partial [Acaulospora morrowiae]